MKRKNGRLQRNAQLHNDHPHRSRRRAGGARLAVSHGPDLAPGVEGGDYGQIILERRLRDALAAQRAALLPRPVSGEVRVTQGRACTSDNVRN